MKLEILRSAQCILLYGYGAEGRSSEAWLKTQCPGAAIEVYEDSSKGEGQGEKGDVIWSDYDVIVKSPGVPPRSIPAEYQSKVTSNLRLFMENLTQAQRQKVIGITGSKGKSTTAKFCHELLENAGFRSAIIGNYGVPALEVWDQIDELDYIVAECSSFQLYDLGVSPHYAIFLSFFADHLDWHDGSKTDYFAAKANLWKHQLSDDYLFVPESLKKSPLPPFEKGGQNVSLFKGDLEGLMVAKPVQEGLFPKGSTLQAAHFRQNLGTVWALAQHIGVKNLETVWQQTAEGFEMIEHRLELVRELDGRQYYNDSIATSPDATIKAVEWLGTDLSVLILDGQDTGVAGCEPLVNMLEKEAPQARVAVVQSDMATAFMQAAENSELSVHGFDDYETMLTWIQSSVSAGAVLFSPAGKSFNRFENYGVRGKYFKELVNNLA